MMKVEERYQHDVQFRHLVDMMEAVINTGNFTPTEIREAAMFAQVKWESLNLKHPIYVTREQLEEIDRMRLR